MEHPTGEGPQLELQVAFDRLHGSGAVSDAGPLAFGGPGEALGLSIMTGEGPADTGTSTNSRHSIGASVRRSRHRRISSPQGRERRGLAGT